MTLLSRSETLLQPKIYTAFDAAPNNLYQAINAVHAALQKSASLKEILDILIKRDRSKLFTKLINFLEKSAETTSTLPNLYVDFHREFLKTNKETPASASELQTAAERIAQKIPDKKKDLRPMFVVLCKLYFQAAFAFPRLRDEIPKLKQLTETHQKIDAANKAVLSIQNILNNGKTAIQTLANTAVRNIKEAAENITQECAAQKSKIANELNQSFKSFSERVNALTELYREVKGSEDSNLLAAYEEEKLTLLDEIAAQQSAANKGRSIETPLETFNVAIKRKLQDIATQVATQKEIIVGCTEEKTTDDAPAPLQIVFDQMPHDTSNKVNPVFVQEELVDFLLTISKLKDVIKFCVANSNIFHDVSNKKQHIPFFTKSLTEAETRYSSETAKIIETTRETINTTVAQIASDHEQLETEITQLQTLHAERLDALKISLNGLVFTFQDRHPLVCAGLKIGAAGTTTAIVATLLSLTRVVSVPQALTISAGATTLLSRVPRMRQACKSTKPASTTPELTDPLLPTTSTVELADEKNYVSISMLSANEMKLYSPSNTPVLFKGPNSDTLNKMVVLKSVQKFAQRRLAGEETNPSVQQFNQAMENIAKMKNSPDAKTLQSILGNLMSAQTLLVSINSGKRLVSQEDHDLPRILSSHIAAIQSLQRTMQGIVQLHSLESDEGDEYHFSHS